MLAMFGWGGGELVIIPLLIFWIWMLVDAIKNPRLNGNDKLIWVLVVLFLNWLGAAIYFFTGRHGGSSV